MTLFGIGTDIIEIERIKKAIERKQNRFISHLFTPIEITYCKRFKEPYGHYAGRFAAKEAVLKALGTGLSEGITWHDIEVRNEENGQPQIHLSAALQKKFPPLTLFITISHAKHYATATCVITTETLEKKKII
jgi:holo-[acyl-carrier protein] synthase